jgi:hypothetical protein
VVEVKERGDTAAAEALFAEVSALSDEVVAGLDRLANTLR